MQKRLNNIIRLLCYFFTTINFNRNNKIYKKIHEHSFAYFFNDTQSNQINVHGVYEHEQLNEIKKIVKEKKTFLDIGANIGNHSIFFSKIFKSVYSFEPHPKIYPILNYNTKDIKNIKTYNFGLSDKKKNVLMTDGSHLGGSSINKIGKRKVKINKLDNIFKYKKIDFIKIDVEGHELEVLKGGEKLLNHNSAILNIEFNIKDFNRKNKIIKFLKKINYKYYYYYEVDENDFDGRAMSIPFKIFMILVRGIKEKKCTIKNINEFKINKKFEQNIICSKYALL
jgi:FkbM family methyltransferase